ncbi:queuosine precursor transporter [Candidatus Spongiihabitans sp.]|uniref:queuosine precursor transporter n=1 Tax=Candidatus Spongiihabitans sp. TaxID=3101308 RepID=UPI003C7C4F9F
MLNTIDNKVVVKIALFHITVIALANYAVQFTATFMGYHFTWAMFVFPLIILATDLTVRLSSQANARVIVGIAYVPAILISAWLADWRIGIASGTAYLVGQLLDITVFQRVRERAKSWWPAPLLSTFFANIIDTYTFFAVAFYQSADEFMAANWIEVASVDLGFKIVVSVVLFLPAYAALLNFLGRKTILHTR